MEGGGCGHSRGGLPTEIKVDERDVTRVVLVRYGQHHGNRNDNDTTTKLATICFARINSSTFLLNPYKNAV